MRRTFHDALVTIQAMIAYPNHLVTRIRSKNTTGSLYHKIGVQEVYNQRIPRLDCRIYDYNSVLLPNKILADQEPGLSIGYPAWNLLYYLVLTSLSAEERELVLVETGTNHGLSTIILAQALKDMGAAGVVRTVDIDPQAVEIAKENVKKAGLSDYVEFYAEDSLSFLSRLIKKLEYIDFALLDGCHEYEHVKKEFAIIYPKVVSGNGIVYFDNMAGWGPGKALRYIRQSYGGNVIRIRSCSVGGGAIWQPN